MRRLIASLCLAMSLAGCSTLGVDTAPASRGIDPLYDDVASIVVVFDLPRGIGPAAGSLFTFDVANGGASEHLRIGLVESDVETAGALPPPATGHAYYLFGFSDADKAAILAAQQAAQARNVAASAVTIGLVPHLCSRGGIDPQTITVSVSAKLPGQSGLLPFIDRQSLADVLTQPGSTQMPACA